MSPLLTGPRYARTREIGENLARAGLLILFVRRLADENSSGGSAISPGPVMLNGPEIETARKRGVLVYVCRKVSALHRPDADPFCRRWEREESRQQPAVLN